MTEIIAQDLCLHYPLQGNAHKKLVGRPSPENLFTVGNKEYILALRNLNFKITEGQRVGLIGHNGSGKSTLLRVMGGIYTPTAGKIETEGKISSLFNINLGVQNEASGRENIIIRALVKGWSRKQIDANIESIIDFSDLREFIDLPIRTYSDGMRMRLLFAIATSFSPEILLLDEWIGAGDAQFQEKAAERMNSLVSTAGITVVASHNRHLLKRICTHCIWLDNGNIKAFDEIDEVYKQYDRARAAQ